MGLPISLSGYTGSNRCSGRVAQVTGGAGLVIERLQNIDLTPDILDHCCICIQAVYSSWWPSLALDSKQNHSVLEWYGRLQNIMVREN